MRIEIIGKPIAKKRPRFARQGKFVKTYNEQVTEEGQALIQIMEQAKDQLSEGKPLTEALSISIIAIFARPKSHYGTGRNAGKLKKTAPEYHTKKLDVDNIAKFYLDVMNNHVYLDDGQCVSLHVSKKWAGFDEREKVVIFIDD
jgi:Holliday junction resolvase RusA-like endonuclease